MSAINAIYAMTSYYEGREMTTEYELWLNVVTTEDSYLYGYVTANEFVYDPPEIFNVIAPRCPDMCGLLEQIDLALDERGFDFNEQWTWSPRHHQFRRLAWMKPVESEHKDVETITLNGKTYRLVEDE